MVSKPQLLIKYTRESGLLTGKYIHTMKSLSLSICLLLALLSGCATTNPHASSQELEPVNDPFEGFNRTMFGFNDGLDRYFLKPVTKGYKYVTPDFVETGVSNFFANLLEITNIFNSALQGKGGDALNYTGRFLVNTTFGIGGLFEVADNLGLEKTEGEDFGQTLGAWGVGSGPYIVLPFLGPTTARDGIGIPVNAYTDPITYVDHVPTRNTLLFTELIDTRSKLLDAEELISGDKYIFIRDAYLQRREYLVNDGEVEDTFGEPGDDF